MGAGGDMGVVVGELSGGWDYDKEGERMDKQQDGGPAFPVSYGPDGAAGFSGGGHVCFYCHHVFDQTKDNPSRTDFCVKCGHRGEGIKRTLEKRDWGILHVVPNEEVTL